MLFFNVLHLIVIIFVLNIECKKPHIVIFLADDMGRNDIGIHGSSQIPTPNIDALGYNGIVLNRHYTMHSCTPSRSALLTGNYPIRAGMQGFPILSGEPRAIPLHMTTMAERFLNLGYNTHLVGKWHLGHENRSVLPLGRGFQTHFGNWNGFVGYFDYYIRDRIFNGFDLHQDYKPAFKYKNQYATNVYTKKAKNIIENHNTSKPLFLIVSHLAPHTGKEGWLLETPTPIKAQIKYNYIKAWQRRLYADIVHRLDTSVGKIVKKLQQKKMLRNTILLFMSDNGAPTSGIFENFGSNWPFRGIKLTLFEGGVRNVGLIWSKLLNKRHYVENTLFHITDWLPTLYSAAGGKVSDLGKIDGINHWPLLRKKTETNRQKDVLLNIDEKFNYSGIISADGRFKLIQGTLKNGIYDLYFGDSGRDFNTPTYNITSILKSDVNSAILTVDNEIPLTEDIVISMRNSLEIQQANASRTDLSCTKNYCLFDLMNDPTETTDLSMNNPEIVKRLTSVLESYRSELVPQTNTPIFLSSNPLYCLHTWFPWRDKIKKCDI